MKIKEILKKSNKILKENNIDESVLKSRILLANVLNVEKEYLISHDEEEVLKSIEEDFFKKLERLSLGEPLQYIINSQEFMALNFYVDENVLIPQPDTEILVENVIALVENLQKNCQKEIKILDLCTGSGIVGVCLYKNLQNVKITASDISDKAIEIAKKNSEQNNADIKFIKSDLFENINERFDIIVSNPPYIETSTIEGLSLEVKHEPKIALDGGKDGLDFYRSIIKIAPKFLENNGYLALEIGYNQSKAVEELLITQKFKNIKIIKDLANLDRVILGKYEI